MVMMNLIPRDKWVATAVFFGLLILLAVRPAEAQTMGDFFELFQESSDQVKSRALFMARVLFGAGALLEISSTALGAIHEKEGPDEILRRLARKGLAMSAIFIVLLRPEFALEPMLGSMERLGATLAGSRVYGPDEILMHGFQLANSLLAFPRWGDFEGAGSVLTPAFWESLLEWTVFVWENFIFWFICLATVLIVTGLLAGQLILARVRLMLVLTVGLFFAGFASFRATSGIPTGWIRYGVQVSVQLLFIQFMFGILDELFRIWDEMIQSAYGSANSPVAGQAELPMILMVVATLILYGFLAVKLPAEIAGKVTGNLDVPISEGLRGNS